MMSAFLGRRWEPAFTYLFLNAAQSWLFSLAFTVNLIYQVSTAGLTCSTRRRAAAGST